MQVKIIESYRSELKSVKYELKVKSFERTIVHCSAVLKMITDIEVIEINCEDPKHHVTLTR